jgi:hypothetical protein
MLTTPLLLKQANYAGVVILDGLVLILAAILNPRANRRRRREAKVSPGDAESGVAKVIAQPVDLHTQNGDEKPARGSVDIARSEDGGLDGSAFESRSTTLCDQTTNAQDKKAADVHVSEA